ncbi:MAG: HNH endonuclease [Candidatus Nanoarchaeia archaeon]|jgi:hypothetical protein
MPTGVYIRTKPHWSKGKKIGPCSEEHKRKLSSALKGRVITTDTRKKISETRHLLIQEGKITTWNKGLTKETDERVLKNVSGASTKTQFKKGHALSKGKKNAMWKGGRTKNSNGYILLKSYNHPRAINGYVFEHILVMESYLGRFLNDDKLIHHINLKKTDNRLKNLRLMTKSEHTRLHNKLRQHRNECGGL